MINSALKDEAFAPLDVAELAKVRATDTSPEYEFVQAPELDAIELGEIAARVTGQGHAPDAVWTYRAAGGQPIFHVCRWNSPSGKTIRPLAHVRGPDGRAAWRSVHHSAPRPLYGLDALTARPEAPVIVCEGEPATEAARVLFKSVVAVTWPGGANAVSKADLGALRGRRVLLWPDHDEPGRRAMNDVARAIRDVASEVKTFDIAALAARDPNGHGERAVEPGWDAADAVRDWAHDLGALRKAIGPLVTLYDYPVEPETEANGTIGTNGTVGPFRTLDRSALGSGRSSSPPFPTALLGARWAAWCKAHAQTRSCPVDYVAIGLLTVAASLIGNARWARVSPEWSEPSVLWSALVGGPSAGKSPALDPVLRMVREIEALSMDAARPRVQERDDEIQRARAAAEAWQSALKAAAKAGEPSPDRPAEAIEPEPLSLPRLIVSDVTAEKLAAILRDNPKGVLSNRDELAGWVEGFGRYSGAGGADRALWLEAFGGRSFRVDRQSKPEPIVIERLSVSVLGGIQPDRLTTINGSADDGLAARFLFAWPDPITGFRVQQEVIDGTDQRRALQRLADLALCPDEFARFQPAYIPLSPTALQHLEDFGGAMRKAANDASGPLAGALGKAVVHAIRLALTIEFLGWAMEEGREPAEISARSMLAAIGLVDGYFIPQARRVFREASIPPDEQAAVAVARWIVGNSVDRFNARDARRRIGGPVRDARLMDSATDALVDAGVIAPAPNRSAATPGRPSKDFIVNPDVHMEAAR